MNETIDNIVEFFFRSSPVPYLFPRSKRTLFTENFEFGMPTGYIYFNNALSNYKDIDEAICPKMKNKFSSNVITGLKEIDFRVYVDLWKTNKVEAPRGSGNTHNITETVKKITVCFLKEEKDADKEFQLYRYTKPVFNYPEDELQIKLTIDSGQTEKPIYIKCTGQSSKTSPDKCVYVPLDLIAAENYLYECDICIEDSTRNIPGEGKDKFEVCATLIHKEKNDKEAKLTERKMPLFIYRTPGSDDGDNPFLSLSLKENREKDEDFFVLPRLNITPIQKPYIKRLQILSNQVLARHKRLEDYSPTNKTGFSFVAEDGETRLDLLETNFRSAIPIFRSTVKDKDDEGLKTCFSYDMSHFGPDENLIMFLKHEYNLHQMDITGIIYDRHFLYGCLKSQDISNAQGLENIYDLVIRTFRERLIQEAQRYVNFSTRWLSRPGWNPNYHRGNFIIPENSNFSLYGEAGCLTVLQISGVSYPLPAGATVKFPAKQKDEYDRDRNDAHGYQISSLCLPNGQEFTPANAFIPLKYEHKKLCTDDQFDENFSDYVPDGGFEQYKNNGVPYYMSELESDNPVKGNIGKKLTIDQFVARLPSLTPAIHNWYAYPDSPLCKPNAPDYYDGTTMLEDIKGIGLDCSGLVMHCMMNVKQTTDSHFFRDSKDMGFLEENAGDIRKNRVRLIDVTISNNNNTLVQSGDIISTNDHIALCSLSDNNTVNLNVYLTNAQKANGDFTIIHNYKGEMILTEGFYSKTLRGPFKHWGLTNPLSNGTHRAGRIYLWY
jgi:hypothetical protein